MQHLDLQNGILDLLNCSFPLRGLTRKGLFIAAAGRGGASKKWLKLLALLLITTLKGRVSATDSAYLPGRVVEGEVRLLEHTHMNTPRTRKQGLCPAAATCTVWSVSSSGW